MKMYFLCLPVSDSRLPPAREELIYVVVIEDGSVCPRAAYSEQAA